MDYLQDLEKHGVSLTEYPLQKVLDSFPLCGQKQKHLSKKFVSVETHPWVVGLQKALEAFISAEVYWFLSLLISLTDVSASLDLCPNAAACIMILPLNHS